MGSSGIFLVGERGELSALHEEPYGSEADLQTLVARYPSLLSGDSANGAGSSDWLLISREMGVAPTDEVYARWSIDHLFVDRSGVPTLVEVKRSSDTRIRREVVGQLLDYAAGSASYWSMDKVIAAFEAECEGNGEKSEDVLAGFIGDNSQEEFWQIFRTNLQAGRIRLVFLADKIGMELQRVVEFLNEQMDPAEVIAIEIKQFEGGDQKTLTSRVLGRSSQAQYRKQIRKKQKWTRDTFFAKLAKTRGSEAADVAEKVLDWSGAHCEIWWGEGAKWGSFVPRIYHLGVKYQLFAVWTSGQVVPYISVLSSKPALTDSEPIRNLLDALNQIGGVSLSDSAFEKEPSFDLAALAAPGALQLFFDALETLIADIRTLPALPDGGNSESE